MQNQIPIVITAFGTTTRALETYALLDARVRERFPDHEVRWAYSSRMVRERVKRSRNLDFPDPGEVLSVLKEEGHDWAVLQSLHVLCGHEFDRLVKVAEASPVRTAVGLPLLSSPQDFDEVAAALTPDLAGGEDEAVVLAGHGTDHPIWCAYEALEQRLRRAAGPRVYVGLVEGDAGAEVVVDRVRADGCARVRLVPFMLVAGRHFLEDLAGGEGSWKGRFEASGLAVELDPRGLGARDGIAEVFCRHVEEALDVIPQGSEGAS
jgi:sirohydrochlorin cobaltochelatase